MYAKCFCDSGTVILTVKLELIYLVPIIFKPSHVANVGTNQSIPMKINRRRNLQTKSGENAGSDIA
jgi:hypothetical protein